VLLLQRKSACETVCVVWSTRGDTWAGREAHSTLVWFCGRSVPGRNSYFALIYPRRKRPVRDTRRDTVRLSPLSSAIRTGIGSGFGRDVGKDTRGRAMPVDMSGILSLHRQGVAFSVLRQ
jgi:hypothetical protein